MPYDTVYKDQSLCQIMQWAVGMQSFGRLLSLGYLMMQAEHLSGDVCEFGCYKGNTARFMHHMTNKTLWLYDSFDGNPGSTPEDNIGPQSEPHFLKGGNKAELSDIYYAVGDGGNYIPPTIRIIPRFFSELKDCDLPETIAFVHFDCNFYASMMQALTLAHPRMVYQAIGVVDDYYHPELPGVAKAIKDYGLTVWDTREPGGERASSVWFLKT